LLVASFAAASEQQKNPSKPTRKIVIRCSGGEPPKAVRQSSRVAIFTWGRTSDPILKRETGANGWTKAALESSSDMAISTGVARQSVEGDRASEQPGPALPGIWLSCMSESRIPESQPWDTYAPERAG
jgi:hypothetical protein